MSTLRRPAKRYIAGLAMVSVVLAAGLLVWDGLPRGERAVLAVVFTALMTVAWIAPLRISFKTHFFFDTSVLVAAILLFEPGAAVLVASGGTALSHIIRWNEWEELVFNSAQTALQAAAGALILVAGGWQVDQPQFSDPVLVPTMLLAGIAMLLVSDLTVAVMVGLQAGTPPVRVWYQSLADTDRVELLAQISQLGLGIMAAVLADAHPWTLSLLLLPAVAVYSALARNIELRRRLEQTLRDTEAALAEAQRVAHLGSWAWDLTTGEQVWSAEVYRIFGIDAQAATADYEMFLRSIHPDDRGVLDQAIHDAMYEGKSFSLDHRILRPDGAERIVHEQGEVIFDRAGEKVRIVGTIHDITERKDAERARDVFLASVSHDLKNPLTMIRGQTYVLGRHLGGGGDVNRERMVEGLASIDAAAVRMTSQIEELVDIAHVQTGQALALQPTAMDLVESARERVARHQQTTDRHRIRVEAEVSELLGSWDKGRLERVLDNLIGNAIKYSPNGGEVTVRLMREGGDSAPCAVVQVQDQGVGIPAADLPHIGERFRRGANVHHITGSGIGLAGVRQIVTQHGGILSVASEEGRGSTFTVRLPLER